jgi:tRNA(fMet)-specific endonuclease VapC
MDEVYLLDTNVASILFNEGDRRYAEIRRRIGVLKPASISICAMTVGEIIYGNKVCQTPDLAIQAKIIAAMAAYQVFEIDHGTASVYGELRARLFDQYSQRRVNGRVIARRVEDLENPTTSKELGIQENDLWITSVAINFDLHFITTDAKIRPILDAAQNLFQFTHVDIWDMQKL